MGLDDREYLRDPSDSSFLAGIGSACKGLIAANLLVFLLQIFTQHNESLSVLRWLALDPEAILGGEVWRLFTWGFGYDGVHPLPLIFDLLFIWWFGRALEEMYGSRELFLFYFAAIVLGSLACLVVALGTGRTGMVVGASAPVMAITVLYAVHYPRHKILLFMLIPVEIWLLVTVYVGMQLFSFATSGYAVGEFTAGLAAAGFGYGYAKWGRRLEEFLPSGRLPTLQLPKSRPSLRVYDPEERVSLDRQVDAILAKISEFGEASLTDAERKTLQDASRRYKKT